MSCRGASCALQGTQGAASAALFHGAAVYCPLGSFRRWYVVRDRLVSGVLAFLVLSGMASHGLAQDAIYRCEGPDGVVEYTNAPGSLQNGRKCRIAELAPITTIPAPRLPSGSAVPRPAPAAVPAAPSAAPGAARGVPASEASPRVDPAVQKARDSDRRRILEDELRKEQSRLGEVRAEFNNGEPERRGDERNYQKYLDRVQRLKDEIARSEANIDALRRELAALRD